MTTIKELLQEGRKIWGDDYLTLSQIVVRLGVTFGDVCRIARGADKDTVRHGDLGKELGNIIVSTIRWADDLGLDVQHCIELALESQRAFAAANKRR